MLDDTVELVIVTRKTSLNDLVFGTSVHIQYKTTQNSQ